MAYIIAYYIIHYVYVFGSPTSLLFRSDLIRSRNPFFNYFGAFEDADACFDLLKQCDFGFVYQVLTFTRVENNSIFSPMRSFNYEDLLRFMILRKYGSIYLEKVEYENCLKRIEKRYLGYLTESLFFRRNKEFWRFHYDNLAVMNYKVTLYRLRAYIIKFLIDLLFNPKKAAGMLLRRFKNTSVVA